MVKNKRGWTSVIEVFVSILLIAGILAVVINSNAVQKPKISGQIYKEQALVLRVIQMDDDLREKVIEGNLDYGNIENRIPDYLECALDNIPVNLENKEIYAKSILITTDGSEYKSKELKLFCWER